jgi:26S proteasome regulatory subunit N3
VRARSARTLQPEVEVYLHLLVLLFLLDSRDKSENCAVNGGGVDASRREELIEQAVNCSDKLMAKVCAVNRRTLDMLAAKCYFYHARTMELAGRLDTVRG